MASRKPTLAELFKYIEKLEELNHDEFYGSHIRFESPDTGDFYDGDEDHRFSFYSLDELKRQLKKLVDEQVPTIEIEDVAGYTAEIYKDRGIILGCQTVTFEKFDEIAKAVAKVRNS